MTQKDTHEQSRECLFVILIKYIAPRTPYLREYP